MIDEAENLLQAVRAAEARGDAEATDRHWREFVRVLWLPMAAAIPWQSPKEQERA